MHVEDFYTYVCTCAHTHTHKRTHRQTKQHTRSLSYTLAHTHTHTHTHTYENINVHSLVCAYKILDLHINMSIVCECIFVNAHTHKSKSIHADAYK